MADNYGILKIIDNYFDKLYGQDIEGTSSDDQEHETSSIDHYSTIYSYLADAYSFLNDPDTFVENKLKNLKLPQELKDVCILLFKDAFYNSAKDVVQSIKNIETKKVRRITIPSNILTENDQISQAFNKLVERIVELRKKYVNRDFFNQLQKENQKFGYDNYVDGKNYPYEETIYFGRELKPRIRDGKADISYYAKYENETFITEKYYDIVTDGEYFEETLIDPEYFNTNMSVFYPDSDTDRNRPIIDVYIENYEENKEGNNVKYIDYSYTDDDGNYTEFEGTVNKNEKKFFHILPYYVKSYGGGTYQNEYDSDTWNGSSYKSINENGDLFVSNIVDDEHKCLIDKKTYYYIFKSTSGNVTSKGIETNIQGLKLYLKTGKYKVTVKYRYLQYRNAYYIKVSNPKLNNNSMYQVYAFGNVAKYAGRTSEFSSDTNFKDITGQRSIVSIPSSITTTQNVKEFASDPSSGINLGLLIYTRRDSNIYSYEMEYVFSDGFLVDYLNNYENYISVILDLFLSIQKSIDEETNYLKSYLQKYFYEGLLDRYREKKINDLDTTVTTVDTNFETAKFPVVKVYETLKGKGRNINGLGTLDFGYYRNNGQNKFVNYYIDKCAIDTDGILSLYIKVSNLDAYLKTIAEYGDFSFSDGTSFIDNIYNRYRKFKNRYNTYFEYFSDSENGGEVVYNNRFYQSIAEYIKNNADELKENLLKKYFFAIRANFTDLNSNLKSSERNKAFFLENRETLENEYFYDINKNCNIDFTFGDLNGDKTNNKYLILKINTGLKPDNNITIGTGILFTRRLIQQFKDNIVSDSKSDFNISRDIAMEPQEFYSSLDDRDTSVVITSGVITDPSGQDLSLDQSGIGLTVMKFPDYKYSSLSKQNDGTYILDVTDFSQYNDIEAIQQIRIVNFNDNSQKFLFNVKGTKSEYSENTTYNITLDFLDAQSVSEKYKISLYDEGTIYIDAGIVNVKDDEYIFKDDDNEKITLNDENLIFENSVLGKGIEENYISNRVLKMNSGEFNLIDKDKNYYQLKYNGEPESVTYYTTKKYLILEPNINSPAIDLGVSQKVKIVDYIISNANSRVLELPKLVYDSLNNSEEYIFTEKYLYAPKVLLDLKYTANTTKFDIHFNKGKEIYISSKDLNLKPVTFFDFKFNLNFKPNIKNINIIYYSKLDGLNIEETIFYRVNTREIKNGKKINVNSYVENTNFSNFISSTNYYGLIVHNVFDYFLQGQIETINATEEGHEITFWEAASTISLTGRSSAFYDLYGRELLSIGSKDYSTLEYKYETSAEEVKTFAFDGFVDNLYEKFTLNVSDFEDEDFENYSDIEYIDGSEDDEEESEDNEFSNYKEDKWAILTSKYSWMNLYNTTQYDNNLFYNYDNVSVAKNQHISEQKDMSSMSSSANVGISGGEVSFLR